MLAHCKERGFVLVTALIMLSLLTLMSLAMFYASRSATQTSATAQNSTEAYYYAETAINYISWALVNDAELDNFKYSGAYQAVPFGEPNVPSSAATVGDFTELNANLWDPGPTGQAGKKAVDTNPSPWTSGQVMYFDNSPICSSPNPADCTPNPPSTPSPQLKKRFLCIQDASKFSNCIDVNVNPASRVAPTMQKISTKLPRYIKLEIASTGVVTPSIPSLPHRNPPVAGEDIPVNGAVVWLTGGTATKDIEYAPAPICKAISGPASSTTIACDANTGQWLSNFGVVVYAIGYVNGKPSHFLRVVIK